MMLGRIDGLSVLIWALVLVSVVPLSFIFWACFFVRPKPPLVAKEAVPPVPESPAVDEAAEEEDWWRAKTPV